MMSEKRKLSEQEQSEIRRLGQLMEQAHQSELVNKEGAKHTYAEMKSRYPEFWRVFGFRSEEEYLAYYKLTDLVK